MAFDFQRNYDVHLILGDPSTPPLWQSDRWAEVFSLLAPLARTARGVPVSSSLQFEAAKNARIRFGRIGWNEAGHDKWTHSSQTTHRFLQTEVWAPSRDACSKEEQPPDFLFILSNQGFWRQDSPTFRDTVLLAVPTGDPDRTQSCAVAAAKFAKFVEAKFHGYMVRPWARSYGASMWTDSLGNMPTTGLFRVGPVHLQKPGNDILQEYWGTS